MKTVTGRSAICLEDGCDSPSRSRELCMPHYMQRRKRGDLPPIQTGQERFWRRVVKRPNGCWEWTGATDSNGYGSLSIDGKKERAHRVTYQWFKGPVAPGLHIDHLCRNPLCCNPDHLEAVTPRVNCVERAIGSVSSINAAKTRCVNGHPFDAANTYYRPDNGGRCCRACTKARRLARAEAAAVEREVGDPDGARWLS